jgi:hypothetical protein
MTNGYISFPLIRPRGLKRWEQQNNEIRFASEISEKNWLLFLKAIMGLHFNKEVTDLSFLRERMKRIKKKEVVARKLDKLIKKGQCFDGKNMKTVSIGGNLIFTTAYKGEELHVVDSPEYGRAMYVFDDYNIAHAWATRRINFREARALALTRVNHIGEWRHRAAPMLPK